jgi:hypothetical protein
MHTTKVNDTLKSNTETAAKRDMMKISYETNKEQQQQCA